MYSICLMFFVLIVLITAEEIHEPVILNIGALFDFEHSSIGESRQELQSAQIAIDEVNRRNEDLFNGLYRLRLIANNSRCDPVYAVDAFFYAIFRRPKLHFLVGTSCSYETKAVSDVADYYNLILFSHSTSFISQANQSYSTLVRLSVSDESYNDARVAFIKYNNWSNVAIIHQDSIEHSLMMAKLARHLNESNINVILTQSASWLNLTSALKNLREKKARIVFVHFDTAWRAIFFCEVYRTFMKQLRQRYVWIFTGNDIDSWSFSISNCTKEEIFQAAHGHIMIDSSYKKKQSFINPNMTAHQLQDKLHLKNSLDRQTLHAYDAIWVIALLIKASIEHNISINTFTYDSVNIRNSWLVLLEKLYFLGISGPVSFWNRQREAETIISQFQIDLHLYSIKTIAEYSHLSGFNINCSKCGSLIWPSTTPIDTERSEIQRVVLKLNEIILITFTCLLGLALAIFFLVFNIVYRHERYIKLSSPNLNNVLVVGAMHIHIAIILFGCDQWFLKHSILGHACMLRMFLFSGGFSLTFGSMFLKTLRVYRIFISHNRPLLHSKLLQDHYLLMICSYIYILDIIFTITWQFLDPQFIEFTYGSIRRVNIDTVVSDEIYYCNSKYRQKILPFIYCYKASFLIIGGYLAAKTRHVHISALNDSKYIVWSIYMVVLTSLFAVIAMISIQNLHIYVFLCLFVVIMTSVILCLIFLPKVSKLKDRFREEVVSKDFYMGHSRTRRLFVEISCFEAYRYAQLQNRELKTELTRLNHSLNMLQQKWDSGTPSVTMALVPLAVCLASTILQKKDLEVWNSGTKNKLNKETMIIPEEKSVEVVNKIEETEKKSLIDTASSASLLHELDQGSSSSSELNLSLALQSAKDSNSLSLSSISNQQNLITDDNQDYSITPIEIKSDNESVLFSCTSRRSDTTEAIFGSDLDRLAL